jgi:sigma-E factor negative regulatory protein RseB
MIAAAHRWRVWLSGCLCLVAILSAAPARASDTLNNPDAMGVLQRAQDVAKTLNYSGVFAHQRDGSMRAFRIVHLYENGDEQELLEALHDTPRQYLRVGDQIQCLVPERRLVILQNQGRERFPALLMTDQDKLSSYYDVKSLELERRVAGRNCTALGIVPKDTFRPRYQLCIDDESGLMLEAQMLSDSGEVLEHIAFMNVDIGIPISESALQPSWSTEGWTVLQRQVEDVDMRELGWRFQAPPGYETFRQVQSMFDGQRRVSQIVLTDGLATLSIFIEPYQQNLSHHQLGGASQAGAVNLFGRRLDSYWIMVAGEAPASAVRSLAESVIRTSGLRNNR